MRYQLLLIVVIFLTACNSKVKQANKRGLEYMKQNLYEQAITEFDNALSINNTWFPVYYNRAISYANTRRYKEALADFNYVIANYPDHADAYFNGVFFMKIWVFMPMPFRTIPRRSACVPILSRLTITGE